MDASLRSQLLSEGSAGAIAQRMGIRIIEASEDKVVATCPVEGNTQPMGLFHGGASAVLAETVASIGSWINHPDGVTMGIEIKVNHMKAVREGTVTATGVPLSIGRTVDVWEIRLNDDSGRLTAFGVCTVAARPLPSDQRPSDQTGTPA